MPMDCAFLAMKRRGGTFWMDQTWFPRAPGARNALWCWLDSSYGTQKRGTRAGVSEREQFRPRRLV